ncbi:hypothetical protein ACEQPO_25505 [Bacillus sp. SL00103]
MKQHFPDQDVWKQPDMVLTLDESTKEPKREGVLLCLREDKEAYLTEKELATAKRYSKRRMIQSV